MNNCGRYQFVWILTSVLWSSFCNFLCNFISNQATSCFCHSLDCPFWGSFKVYQLLTFLCYQETFVHPYRSLGSTEYHIIYQFHLKSKSNVICILSPVAQSFSSHTSVYEKSEWNVSEYIWFVGLTFSNWLNDLFGTNVHKTLEACWYWLLTIQWTNINSVISNCRTFSPFLPLVILLSVLSSSFKVSNVKCSR